MTPDPSPFATRAAELQELIKSLAEFAGIPVVIVRRKLLISEVETQVAKAGAAGACVLIGWESGRNLDEGADSPAMQTLYHIQIWSRPTIRREEDADPESRPAFTSDELETAVLRALHNWQPPSADHPLQRALVRQGMVVDDEKFLVRDIEAAVRVDL